MNKLRPGLFFAAFFLGLCFTETASASSILARLGAKPELAIDGFPIAISQTTAFYETRENTPAWTGSPANAERAERVLTFMGRAHEEGLDSHDYAIVPLAKRLVDPARDAIDTEILFTHAVLHYIADMQTGRVAPRLFDPNLFVAPRNINTADTLTKAIQSGDPASYLAALSPPYPEYRRLRRALADYRKIRERGGFTQVPHGPSLRFGAQDSRVEALGLRLKEENYLDEATGTTFDAPMEQAVRRFQANHGLAPDGVAGKQTLARMNEQVDHHIGVLILNLERWRWLADDLGRRHVRVNIADFSMRAHEGTREVLRMKAIVGKPARMTPIFSSVITDVLFQPYWYVPERLAREDILPKLKNDAAYLVSEGFSVYQRSGGRYVPVTDTVDWASLDAKAPFPFLLRQNAGPLNALGPMKFTIRNPWDIYMHGTPANHLFGAATRAFSSGCIRLEDPLALAHFLFAYDTKTDRARLNALYYNAVNEPPRQPVMVTLTEAVPVHIVYWTAWADQDGSVHFVDDVYGRDTLLSKALGL